MTLSRDSEVIEQEAERWFMRRQGDNWTDAHQAHFDAWLQHHVAHRIAFIRIETIWKRTERMIALGAGVAPGVIPPRGLWGAAGVRAWRSLDACAPIRTEEKPTSEIPEAPADTVGDSEGQSGGQTERDINTIGLRPAPEGCVRGIGGLLRLKNKPPTS